MIERFVSRPGNRVLLAYYLGYIAACALVMAYVLQAMADQAADREAAYVEDVEALLFRERMERLAAERAAERVKEQPVKDAPERKQNVK